ncbi:UNVERIFIED_CONTAM: hypothetical protein HDU68_012077 [Siphonaria sp. JEL0065]|nr:hypothetical protein HDU68_012077 [Siphonaria sp. JEL0065]
MSAKIRKALFGSPPAVVDTEAVILSTENTHPTSQKIEADVTTSSRPNKKYHIILGIVALIILIAVGSYFGYTSSRNAANASLSSISNAISDTTGSNSTNSTTTPAINFTTANTAKPNPKIAKFFLASTNIPGNLPLSQTPQFVTLTADDAVQQRTFSVFTPILQSFRNPNGCFLPATYFVSNNYTEYKYVTELYGSGSEIAVHTVDHTDLGTASSQAAQSEIQSSFTITHNLGGIPSSSLIGFRHPFLSYSATTFGFLKNAGFTYDSSISVNPVTTPYWPHTLDEGLPYPTINCPSCPPTSAKRDFVFPG